MQGCNERYLWKRYPRNTWLVPILWEWNGIVCQRRVKPLDKTVTRRKLEYTRLQVIKQVPELEVYNCDLHNRENWGTYNNKIVLLDYGISPDVANMYKA